MSKEITVPSCNNHFLLTHLHFTPCTKTCLILTSVFYQPPSFSAAHPRSRQPVHQPSAAYYTPVFASHLSILF